MDDILTEPVAELLALLATGSVSLVGLIAERAALANILTDHLVVGVWEAWIGALALFAGVYMLGYQRLWRPLREPEVAD